MSSVTEIYFAILNISNASLESKHKGVTDDAREQRDRKDALFYLFTLATELIDSLEDHNEKDLWQNKILEARSLIDKAKKEEGAQSAPEKIERISTEVLSGSGARSRFGDDPKDIKVAYKTPTSKPIPIDEVRSRGLQYHRHTEWPFFEWFHIGRECNKPQWN